MACFHVDVFVREHVSHIFNAVRDLAIYRNPNLNPFIKTKRKVFSHVSNLPTISLFGNFGFLYVEISFKWGSPVLHYLHLSREDMRKRGSGQVHGWPQEKSHLIPIKQAKPPRLCFLHPELARLFYKILSECTAANSSEMFNTWSSAPHNFTQTPNVLFQSAVRDKHQSTFRLPHPFSRWKN